MIATPLISVIFRSSTTFPSLLVFVSELSISWLPFGTAVSLLHSLFLSSDMMPTLYVQLIKRIWPFCPPTRRVCVYTLRHLKFSTNSVSNYGAVCGSGPIEMRYYCRIRCQIYIYIYTAKHVRSLPRPSPEDEHTKCCVLAAGLVWRCLSTW